MVSSTRQSAAGIRLLPLAAGLAIALAGSVASASEPRWPPVLPQSGYHVSNGALAPYWRPALGTPAHPASSRLARSRPPLSLDGRSHRPQPTPVASDHPDGAGSGSVLKVTSCADDGGSGTLREVVAQAVSGDTVDLTDLTCSVVTLATGVISTDVDDLTIRGPGADALTIDGANQSLLLKHTGAGTLTLEGVSAVNGKNTKDTGYTAPWVCDYCTYIAAGCVYSSNDLLVRDVVISGCSVEAKGDVTARGGGVYARNHLTVENSTISDNSVVADWVSMGGGVHGGRAVTLTTSKITGNVLLGDGVISYGAGVAVSCWFVDAQIDIAGSEVSGNIASAYSTGGGVFVCGGATVTGSTIGENMAGVGGGVGQNFSDGSLVFVNSTISGNRALDTGGGIHFNSSKPHRISLTNSTVALNLAGAYLGGGGIQIQPPDDGTIDLNSSIVAQNGPNGYFAADIGFYPDLSLVVIGSNNLVGQVSPLVQLPVGTLRGDPQLLPLAANGGLSRTHALAPSSPALDAGNNDAGLAFDQRGHGYARLSGSAPDIGAFETQQADDVLFRDGFEGE